MAQVRIVLKDEVAEIAQDLLELTRLSNISELTSVLYSRYAKHLKATWEVQPAIEASATPDPLFQPTAPQSISAFSDSINL